MSKCMTFDEQIEVIRDMTKLLSGEARLEPDPDYFASNLKIKIENMFFEILLVEDGECYEKLKDCIVYLQEMIEKRVWELEIRKIDPLERANGKKYPWELIPRSKECPF